ncbi:hypothetical protein ACP4OV_014191 [Aristida adscensionis]
MASSSRREGMADVNNKFPAGMRVLAVDDDGVSIKILEKQLRRCQYDVTTAMCGEVALELLRARKNADHQFDLVICDLYMPGMNGFQLLERVSLEMNDIPFIMLSANGETEMMMKGMKQGACDYLVKPVPMEQLTNIWLHVVRKSKPDPSNHITGVSVDACHKLQHENVEGEKNCVNYTRKYTRKNKNDGHVEGQGNSSTQKRKRVKWCPELHHKFLVAVHDIGIENAVPKLILEKMNVDGISRENVASHLQKYRMFLKKIGASGNYNPFVDEPRTWWSGWKPLTLESLNHHSEPGRCQPSPTFHGSLNTGNSSARLNSPSALGSGNNLLPVQLAQPKNSQRNLGIRIQDVPSPVQDASKFNSFIDSYANPPNGGPPAASNYTNLPNGDPWALSNVQNRLVASTSKSFPSGICGSSFANISTDCTPPLCTGNRLPSCRLDSSCAEVLRSKMLGSSRGIPFDSNDSFEDVENREMLHISSPSQVLLPKFVNQPSVQTQSSSAIQVASPISKLSSSWNGVAPPNDPDLGHKDTTSQGPSQPHANSFNINQLARYASSSSQVTPSGNEFQNKMVALMRKPAPTVCYGDQVAPLNLGTNAGSSVMLNGNSALGGVSRLSTVLPNPQMVNSVMLNGGVASGNVPEKSATVYQLAVGDQMNNSSERLVGIEFQNQIASLMNNPASMVRCGGQATPSNLGTNAGSSETLNGSSTLGGDLSFSSVLPEPQMVSSTMPTQMLNGGVANGNLSEQNGTTDQRSVCDELNNNSESPLGIGEVQNGIVPDLDDNFFAGLFAAIFSNDDVVLDGDLELTP